MKEEKYCRICGSLKYLALLVCFAGIASATNILPLTTVNSDDFVNDAYFRQATFESAGSGVLNIQFLRIQANDPITQGYNSSFRPVELGFQAVSNAGQNYSLLLTDVGTLVLDLPNGPGPQRYFLFALDANESTPLSLISIDRVQVFLSQNAALTGYPFTGSAFKIWDLDLGPLANSTVMLDAELSAGSGKGDMFFFLPVDLVYAYPGLNASTYMYLYTEFGAYAPEPGDQPYSGYVNNGGFEEWAYLTGEVYNIPEPSTMLLVAGGLVGFGAFRRWRRRPH